MILKNYILLYYSINFFFFFNILGVRVILWFFTLNDIYYKIILYFSSILYFSGIGLYYHLDLMILLFILIQFSNLLVLLALLMQINTHKLILNSISGNFFICIILLCLFYFREFSILPILNFNDIFLYCYDLWANDFFIIFYYFFEECISATYLIITILFLFSIFFILFFYSLKLIKSNAQKTVKTLQLFKKQQLNRQNHYKPNLYVFYAKHYRYKV